MAITATVGLGRFFVLNTKQQNFKLTKETITSNGNIQKQLGPLQQKIVEFQGDEITAVRTEDHRVYAPIRPVCDFLGLDPTAQRRRIARDDILSEVMQRITITTLSGDQSMRCLPIEFLNDWLFGVQTNRVKEAYREKIREYKMNCYTALAIAFSPTAFGPYDGPSIGLGITP